MIWLWIVLAVVVLAALLYWQFIIAEGSYFGPKFVAWTYDLVASRYDRIKQFVPIDEAWFLASPIVRALQGTEDPVILDVATGTGQLPLALMQAGFQGRVIGLDLSQGMIRQANLKLQAYGGRVSFIWQDAMRLPFANGTFEAVTCFESLEFMPRPLAALEEMVRVLAPNGVLVVTNRVGAEARLLPGRTLSRPEFQRSLATLPLNGIEVRRWQVQYDLATARRNGDIGKVHLREAG
jgi:SAM-dependent methyltransferase